MSNKSVSGSSAGKSAKMGAIHLFTAAEVKDRGVDRDGNVLIDKFGLSTEHDKLFVDLRRPDLTDWRDINKMRVSSKPQAKAALGQQGGIEVDIPCTHCADHCGPFSTCRVVIFENGSVAHEGSCMNCSYGGGASRCSFRKEPPPDLIARLQDDHPHSGYLVKRKLVASSAVASGSAAASGSATSPSRKRKIASSPAAPATPTKRPFSSRQFESSPIMSSPSKSVLGSSKKKQTGAAYPIDWYNSPLDDKNVYAGVKTGDFANMVKAYADLLLVRERLDADRAKLDRVLREHGAHPDQQVEEEEQLEDEDENPFAEPIAEEEDSEEIEPVRGSPLTPSKRGRGRPRK